MQASSTKKYDLEERTTKFAKEVIRVCQKTRKNPMNDRIVGQIVGSAGSIGANYREANDALGKKDFVHRIRIARKESKETLHWLDLMLEANQNLKSDIEPLIGECTQLRNILSAIIQKVSL